MSGRLRLQFDDAEAFRVEFEKNIAKGGAFVSTADDFELRTIIEVELVLSFCGESRVLEAEVVHAVPGTAVAVEFLRPATELRDELGSLVDGPSIETPGAPLELADAAERLELGAEPDAVDLGGEPAFGEGLDLGDAPPDANASDFDEDAIDFEDRLDFDTGDLELGEGGGADDDLDALDGIDPMAISADDLSEALGNVSTDAEPASAGAAEAGAIEDPLAALDDRRRAHRAVARVPARLDTTNVSLEGRTRDLSETGVLISADANELPIGRDVQLALQHPTTGERFQIAGKVSRHIQGEGTVAAVAIAFAPEDEEQDAQVRAFVNETRRLDAERSASGISGRIEELGMPGLIQMLSGSSTAGTLTAECGQEEAVLAFEGQNLRYVRLGALRGVKALSRMLRWETGRFSFHSEVDALQDEDEPVNLTSVLLEAARQLDESDRRELAAFDPEATYRVVVDAIADGAPSQTEQAVLELAAAGLTARRIMDVIPEPDAQVREAITELVACGALQAGD